MHFFKYTKIQGLFKFNYDFFVDESNVCIRVYACMYGAWIYQCDCVIDWLILMDV